MRPMNTIINFILQRWGLGPGGWGWGWGGGNALLNVLGISYHKWK